MLKVASEAEVAYLASLQQHGILSVARSNPSASHRSCIQFPRLVLPFHPAWERLRVSTFIKDAVLVSGLQGCLDLDSGFMCWKLLVPHLFQKLKALNLEVSGNVDYYDWSRWPVLICACVRGLVVWLVVFCLHCSFTKTVCSYVRPCAQAKRALRASPLADLCGVSAGLNGEIVIAVHRLEHNRISVDPKSSKSTGWETP